MNNKQLNDIETDLKTIITDSFHVKNLDLMKMLFYEDIPELIKFARKVNKAFDFGLNQTGEYFNGYNDALAELKIEIFE